MISLQLLHPHWIKNSGDDPSDQCAHGFIELSIGETQFISESDGEWTVSAAALFLLRTVNSNHSAEDSVAEGNFLVPCCGFSIFPGDPEEEDFYILGCPNGLDPTICHTNGMIHISLDEKSAYIALTEWAQAVLSFSDQVQQFYDSSAPKDTLEDELDRAGWQFFWKDWHRQRQVVRSVLGYL